MTKFCACKGIRSCLICKPIAENEPRKDESNITYIFCINCERAWEKTSKVSNQMCDHTGQSIPFPGVRVLYDFVSEQEEMEIVNSIDRVPWVDSQSGRRKQDYGPKVNFKKKKLKTSIFTGLPPFSKKLIDSMKSVDLLQDFETVELCNLEYIPERGAAIDPHKDDEWLWGERLVTLNLLSDTRYTMTLDNSCDVKGVGQFKKNGVVSGAKNMCSKMAEEHNSPIVVNGQQCEHSVKSCRPESHSSSLNELKNPEESLNSMADQNEVEISEHSGANISSACGSGNDKTAKLSYDHLDKQKDSDLKTIEVEIEFPRRALLVLYGPARTVWKHGIKSSHIASRRIATTMRELTPLFRDGGQLEHIGKDILEKAKSFDGLSVGEFEARERTKQNESLLNACTLQESNNNVKCHTAPYT